MEEKRCENCANYFPHYYIKNMKLRKLGFGHCFRDRTFIKHDKRVCEKWKYINKTEQEIINKETVQKHLKIIAQYIKNLLIILNDK